MVGIIYFLRMAIGDLMKIVPILFNVLWKKLALEEEMQNISLLNFIQVSVKKAIMGLFAVFVKLIMEKSMKINAQNVAAARNLDTFY